MLFSSIAYQDMYVALITINDRHFPNHSIWQFFPWLPNNPCILVFRLMLYFVFRTYTPPHENLSNKIKLVVDNALIIYIYI